MVSIVNSVSRHLVSADSNFKMASTAMDVFQIAQAKNDQGMMDRAMSYAGPALEETRKDADSISDDLKKAMEAIHEEKKVEQKEDAKKADEKNADKKDEAQKADQKEDAKKSKESSKVDESSSESIVPKVEKSSKADAVEGSVGSSSEPSLPTPIAPVLTTSTSDQTVGVHVDVKA